MTAFFLFYGPASFNSRAQMPKLDAYQPEIDPQSQPRVLDSAKTGSDERFLPLQFKARRYIISESSEFMGHVAILENNGKTFAAILDRNEIQVPTDEHYKHYMGDTQFRYRRTYLSELRYFWVQIPFKMSKREEIFDIAIDRRERTPVIALIKNKKSSGVRIAISAPNSRPWGSSRLVHREVESRITLPSGFVPQTIEQIPTELLSDRSAPFGTYYFLVKDKNNVAKRLRVRIINPTRFLDSYAIATWAKVKTSNTNELGCSKVWSNPWN